MVGVFDLSYHYAKFDRLDLLSTHIALKFKLWLKFD